MTEDVDIAIIGAGAAGLAAAHRLAAEPLKVRVLEARDRIGGRAFTADVGGYSSDLGCGWLHSADVNPFSRTAERLGFVIDKTPPHWSRQAGNQDFSPGEQAAFGRALGELEERVEAAAARGEDRAVSDLFDLAGPWTPLLNAFSAYYNGAEFDQISTLDYAAYDDSEVNWRLPAGYGTLVSSFGSPAPVTLRAPVSRVDHSGVRLRLTTAKGEVTAGVAIVAVPTPLIASGALAFTPDLAGAREAAAALPLGLADKVLLGLSQPEALPVEGHLFGDPSRTETGSYHLRPFGRPLIEVFLGGRHALALEQEGPGASAAFAIEELAGLLGSDIRARLTPLAATAWAADPFAQGSYSHAVPGGAWARAALAQPFEGRIIFAGEACSPHAFSTAHGAAQSGVAAAELALAARRT